MAPEKVTRLNLRVTAEQNRMIRDAADASHTSVTDFLLETATQRAQQVLADRRWFELTDTAWARFEAALDRPAILKPRLVASMSEDDPFVD